MNELTDNDARVPDNQIPGLKMDELSIGMMTSSAASRAANSDGQGSDETQTKMRYNIKKHLV